MLTKGCVDTRDLEAEAEAVGFVSRFQIGGWDSYEWNNYKETFKKRNRKSYLFLFLFKWRNDAIRVGFQRRQDEPRCLCQSKRRQHQYDGPNQRTSKDQITEKHSQSGNLQNLSHGIGRYVRNDCRYNSDVQQMSFYVTLQSSECGKSSFQKLYGHFLNGILFPDRE